MVHDPIFLAGGNARLALSGSTFTSRLRCSLESSAYVNVYVEDEFHTPPITLTLRMGDGERVRTPESWDHSDSAARGRNGEEQVTRLPAAFARHQGGILQFDAYAQAVAHIRNTTTNHLKSVSPQVRG